MNGLSNKLDYIDSRGDVLANSVTNINTAIANTSNRIDGMENTFNNSITNITNDMTSCFMRAVQMVLIMQVLILK